MDTIYPLKKKRKISSLGFWFHISPIVLFLWLFEPTLLTFLCGPSLIFLTSKYSSQFLLPSAFSPQILSGIPTLLSMTSRVILLWFLCLAQPSPLPCIPVVVPTLYLASLLKLSYMHFKVSLSKRKFLVFHPKPALRPAFSILINDITIYSVAQANNLSSIHNLLVYPSDSFSKIYFRSVQFSPSPAWSGLS